MNILIGIMSYWLAYFAGSIGGGLGKVLEYYYCYYKLYQIRDKRRKKFNFEQLAEDDLKQVFKDSNEFEEGSFEKGAINPHDYIDDKLLDKLFYTTNANQADFGPRLAINGLIGFSLAMSGHYLFKKLQQLFQKPLDGSNENDNEIIDGAIVSSIHDDDNIDEDMSLWSEIKGIVKDLFGQIRDYIGSTFTITAYHLIVFGFCSLQLSRNTYRYIQQNIHKRSEKGGYSYLNAGPGINGVDLGSLTSIFSGIMIYPFVLKIGEIWRWNKRVQSLKNNINNNINENNNNKHKDNNVNK